MSAVVTSTWAGSPSRIATRDGPWDSPAVSQRNMAASLSRRPRGPASPRPRPETGEDRRAQHDADQRAEQHERAEREVPVRSTIRSSREQPTATPRPGTRRRSRRAARPSRGSPAPCRGPRRGGRRRTPCPAGGPPQQPEDAARRPASRAPRGPGRPASCSTRSRRSTSTTDHEVRRRDQPGGQQPGPVVDVAAAPPRPAPGAAGRAAARSSRSTADDPASPPDQSAHFQASPGCAARSAYSGLGSSPRAPGRLGLPSAVAGTVAFAGSGSRRTSCGTSRPPAAPISAQTAAVSR